MPTRTEPAINDAIEAILEETGESDPGDAIRAKAREIARQYHSTFNEEPPFNMLAMASSIGIRRSEEAPIHSPDAELHPEKDGRLFIRLNQDRPKTRQRFSIGHEISHTCFPGYRDEVQCRKSKERDWSDPSDVIEWLCDVGASEFLFPTPWFDRSVEGCAGTAESIMQLAKDYQASTDATVRRYVEITNEPHAAVFFVWKLKPTQKSRSRRPDEPDLYGVDPAEEALLLKKLRVEYAIVNPAFENLGFHIPNDKSVDTLSVIVKAATSIECLDAEEHLDLGPCHGTFKISAIPLYTGEGCDGPNGEQSVVAILRPLPRKRRNRATTKQFFG